jgi:hypothetical protein
MKNFENGAEIAQTTSEEVKMIVSFNEMVETFKKLTALGIKFARLENNRTINVNNVASKKKSIKEIGVLQPITVIEGEKVVEQGYEIVDFETGEPINDPENYNVVIDGQHRFVAYLQLKTEAETDGKLFDKELPVIFMNVEDVPLLKVLKEINNEVKKWVGGDYVNLVEMTVKGMYPLLTEISNLTKKGYSLESACRWLTFGNDITKTLLNKVASGESLPEKIIGKITNIKGIKRGLNILDSASQTLSEDVLKTRVIPDWIRKKYDNTDDAEKGTFETDMCNFFESFVKKQSEAIEKAKGQRGVRTKEDIVLGLLDEYFYQFTNNRKEVA